MASTEYRPAAVSSVKLERQMYPTFPEGQSYLAHALLPKHWTSTLNTSIGAPAAGGRMIV